MGNFWFRLEDFGSEDFGPPFLKQGRVWEEGADVGVGWVEGARDYG